MQTKTLIKYEKHTIRKHLCNILFCLFILNHNKPNYTYYIGYICKCNCDVTDI